MMTTKKISNRESTGGTNVFVVIGFYLSVDKVVFQKDINNFVFLGTLSSIID